MCYTQYSKIKLTNYCKWVQTHCLISCSNNLRLQNLRLQPARSNKDFGFDKIVLDYDQLSSYHMFKMSVLCKKQNFKHFSFICF